MEKKSVWLYHQIVVLPDRLYPFRSYVEGQWVRGMRSYDAALRRSFRKYGPGHYSYGLTFYRTLFHLLGSLFVIYTSTFIAFDLFGGQTALVLLLALLTAFITYQEFFLQRRVYRQLWRKGALDWFVWVAPVAVYVFLFH